MNSVLVVTDAGTWTAEAEYALAVVEAEVAVGTEVVLAVPEGASYAADLPGRPRRAGEGSEQPLRVVELPGPEPRRSFSDLLANIRWIAALSRRERFDAVLSSGSAAHLAAVLAVGRRAPVVHLRGIAREPRGHAANRFLYRKLTSVIVVPSARVRDWVVETLRVPSDRVHRILLPVADDHFAERSADGSLRTELGIEPGVPLVVNVARLAPVKGHAVLVRAMADVARRVPEARLLLVGEPWAGEPEGLRSLARELGIEDAVVFAGRREDITRILADAAVCVCSSIGSEENSRAVSEYMAAGRPVVATSVGVIPELVDDGTSALLVEPGDPEGLARAIVSVLEDRDLADRMGREGRRLARERVSVESFAARLGQAFGDVRGEGTSAAASVRASEGA